MKDKEVDQPFTDRRLILYHQQSHFSCRHHLSLPAGASGGM
jgi:hypothetical protein